MLDAVGATPILGLLVANTDAALQACLAIFHKVPTSMLSKHGPGPFTGENTLHVVSVNKHEKMVLLMVDLAFEHYDRHMLEDFCPTHTTLHPTPRPLARTPHGVCPRTGLAD